jgi:tetratricopeptide (TPR) repeat protein
MPAREQGDRMYLAELARPPGIIYNCSALVPGPSAEDLSMSIRSISPNRSLVVAIAAVLVIGGSVVRADSFVASSSGEGKGIPYNNVKIVGIEGDALAFRTAAGQDSTRPLAQVQQITIDGETAFNDAESAYLAGDFAKAVEGYQKTVRATSKDWIKDRSAQRLVEAAGKVGRFDAAVTGYVALVSRSPELAASSKPQLPEGKSTFLDSAAKEVETASNDGKLKPEQRAMLLSFLLELHRARGDNAAAGAAAERLLKVAGNDASNPAAAAALADMKLNLARLALDSKNYQKALTDIEQNRAIFTDPAQQVQALFVLAEAKAGLAGDKTDKNTLHDIALAYMRVVTFGKDQPAAQEQVATSLSRTAAILEQLKQPKQARDLYQQVATAYPDSPLAADAKAAMDRLAGAK